jgi:hypothetical protein
MSLTAQSTTRALRKLVCALISMVMRRRWRILAVFLVLLAMLTGLAFVLGEGLVDPMLLRVQGFSKTTTNEQERATPCIVLRLTKADAPYLELADEQSIEFRTAGKWLTPERLDGRTLTIAASWPACGQVGVIPNRRGTEAFRLHLAWRRQSLRDQAEVSLVQLGNRGWKVPKVCFRLYTLLPQRSVWRHTVIKMELPKQPDWSAPGYEPAEPPHK